MTGGLGPPALVTENLSVRHWPAAETGTTCPSLPPTTPEFFTSVVTVSVEVLGPVMMKVSKSSRS